ncbi:MAG: anaerobic ribonucleoside-triphosphate reductase activating protein [Clostridia bacterium]|nr:anaerobic ribonucleoside-triphosphate reductase activating protein [Clostridia bacterium]
MKIHGLQKVTLLDYPEHVACTVFTAGCNLRCPFCHNAILVTDILDTDAIPEEEFFSFLKKRRGMLDGVAVTGGEPLLQPDLRDFIEKIRDLGLAVKLDTNGCFPDRLRSLVDAHLVDYVAMDVKNVPEKYAETVGIPGFDPAPVKESVALLLEGRVAYEFRTTVVSPFHTVGDIEGIARWIRGTKRYYLQNFVDSGHLVGHASAVPRETLFEMRDRAAAIIPTVALRGVD